MTIDVDQIQQLTGKVYSQNSDKVGSIGQIYLDDASGAPSWVTVKTGLFGTAESFVPLEGARSDGDDVHVAFSEDQIKNAPRVESDGSITPEEESRLYEYYNLSDGDDSDTHGVSGDRDLPIDADDDTETGDRRADLSDQTVGADRSGPTTDGAMTRSEERLSVGTASRESGRARLRKYVTSETVSQTVPVSREEVTLEREPITDANVGAATSGPDISEEEHEVVLHEEVPTVDKDVVPVERVKLGKETVTDNATVSEEVRKENVEMVEPGTDSGTDRR